jgi:ParB-like chromosome segregation protein Spo0J
MQNRTLTNIDRNTITIDATFRHRSGPDSSTHLAALRKTLRNTGRLDPVMVWQEEDANGTPTGRLVLLDGHYRVAAYRAEQAAGKIEGRGIPAMLITGNPMEAHLAALMVNSKDNLPLTMPERLNAAWRLVRTFRGKLSKRRLAQASGISERSIARMRKQFRKFLEAKEVPDGNWQIDRRFPLENAYTPPSDEARKHMVDTLSQALRVALNEVKTRDVEIIGDALQEALGARQWASIADYLGGDDREDDGDTEWMEQDEFEGVDLDAEDLGDHFEIAREETVMVH